MNKIKLFTLIGILLSFTVLQAKVVTQEEFINDMVSKHNFNKLYLTQLLGKAEVKSKIIKLMTPRKKGKAKPWHKYRTIFVNDKKIKGGVKFWRNNAKTLQRAEKIFGVPAKIIVSIIGVETIYGKNTGSFRVLDALVTLAFYYPRRADYFRKELENYLILTREERLNPLRQKGSYAGAMGIGQFMPSSFLNYAIDFDGDGKRNIWTNNVDAIGSVANYFKQHGWKTGSPVITATKIRTNAIKKLLSLDFAPKYTLQQLKKWGLLYFGKEPNYTNGMVIDLETKLGTAYWLGFQNYYVITRYNRSKHYAMAVYQLAQEIENAK
ncbi:lytic murein transglycosylase B [Candidatus Halobeggiatoa sp. HSG11]|nr:lytic murein transglycosylase B [Candidatus Halobeggiatoa sp. HSG11]